MQGSTRISVGFGGLGCRDLMWGVCSWELRVGGRGEGSASQGFREYIGCVDAVLSGFQGTCVQGFGFRVKRASTTGT